MEPSLQTDTTDETSQKPRQRRWFSLSLRTFCLLFVIFGLVIGFWSTSVRPLRQQWSDAEAFLSLPYVKVTTKPVDDLAPWMAYFLPLDQRYYIDSIKIRGRTIGSDKAEKKKIIAAISRMPRLERLYLEETDLTDQDCQILSRIKTLKRAAMWYTGITDDGVAGFADLPELEILDVHGTAVSWKTHHQFRLKDSSAKLVTDYSGRWVFFTSPNRETWRWRSSWYVQTEGELAKLRQLQKQKLTGFTYEVGTVSLESIMACNHLETLTIYCSQRLTDEELKRVLTLKHLKQVQLNDSFDHEVEDPQARSDAKWKYANRIARLLTDRVKKLDVCPDADRLKMSFVANHTGGRTQIVQVQTGSLRDSESLKSFTELPRVGWIVVRSPRPVCTSLFNSMPNLSRVTFLGVAELNPKMIADVARLERLKRFHLKFDWLSKHRAVLPNSFFQNWNSQDSLSYLRLEGLDEFNFESRKPLEKFPRLKAIQVLLQGAEYNPFH